MSYEIISAIGRVIGSQSIWEKVDLENRVLSLLYNRYSTIRAELKNRYTKKSGYIIVDDFQPMVPENLTFREYLDMQGEKAVPLREGSVRINRKGIIYKEAFSSGFKIYPVRSGAKPDGDYSDKANYRDLYLTKEKIDHIDMFNHVLVSVNGYLHQTDATSKGLWVYEGYKTICKRNKHCIGLYSFENIGSIKQIPITEDMIYKINDDYSLYDNCIIDIGEDCSDKTIMVSIGGFLHVLDYDAFTQVSLSAIRIKFNNIPLMERINLSGLDIEIPKDTYDKRYGETNTYLEHIYSDRYLIEYLTSPYSFIILLDNSEVFKEITYPQQRGIPNNYLTDHKPLLPMMTRLGKLEEYVAVPHEDKYVLETANCQYRPRLYNYRWPVDRRSYLNDASIPLNRYRIPTAYFFNLVSFLGKN